MLPTKGCDEYECPQCHRLVRWAVSKGIALLRDSSSQQESRREQVS